VPLGTLVWEPDVSLSYRNLEVAVKGSAAATGDLLWLDYLALTPARRSFMSPTGKTNNAAYPDALSYSTTVAQGSRRVIYSDLTSAMGGPRVTQSLIPASAGVGGEPFEPDPGSTAVLVLPAAYPPLDPATFQTAAEPLVTQMSVGFAITPRYFLAAA
jgi:hypothetical protein